MKPKFPYFWKHPAMKDKNTYEWKVPMPRQESEELQEVAKQLGKIVEELRQIKEILYLETDDGK